MRLRCLVALTVVGALPLAAQTALTRSVRAGILRSAADPRASFTVDTSFHYAGGQHIDILEVAGAEQHFFLQTGRDSSIQRFYWMQFEYYYPSNAYTYDYSDLKQEPVPLGAITFQGDVRTLPGLFTLDPRPGSDLKAGADYLRSKGLTLDGTFVTLRMVYLTDSTRRREILIIYGERLPPGAHADPLTTTIVSRAQQGLRIQ